MEIDFTRLCCWSWVTLKAFKYRYGTCMHTNYAYVMHMYNVYINIYKKHKPTHIYISTHIHIYTHSNIYVFRHKDSRDSKSKL